MVASASTQNSTVNTLTLIRNAAEQTGFLNRVFTQGANGISPAQIALELQTVFKIAGVTLPPDVKLGIDGVQILLAGGAVAKDLSGTANTLQCVGSISGGISAVSTLLSDLGIVDQSVADVAGLASNLSLALSSGGANVLADIGIVLSLIACVGDLGRGLFGSKDAAITAAKKSLASQEGILITPQLNFAANAVQQFNAGKLNYFDLVGGIALNSPVEFKQFFPDLSTYFPSWINLDLVGQGSSSGLFSSQSDSETASFLELVTNKKQVEAVLINYFIARPLSKFSQFNTVEPCITIEALSIVTMLANSSHKGPVIIGLDFDVLTALQILGVTPYMLGDDWLFKGLRRNETNLTNWKTFLPYSPQTLPQPVPFSGSGVSINGVTQYTQIEKQTMASNAKLASLQLEMQRLDSIGDIDSLLKIPEAVAMLKRYSKISLDGPISDGSINPIRPAQPPLNSKIGPVSDVIAPISPNVIDTIASGSPVSNHYQVDLSDYWKCLSVLKTMEASNLFQDQENILYSFGDIDAINKKFQEVYQFVLNKSLNRLARQRVARSLGIPENQLASRLNADGSQVFYQKAG